MAVIGGSFAGLTAALYVARARRSVAVHDNGLTRNRFSHNGHGVLGMGGLAPKVMPARGIADVLAYPTASLRAETVVSVIRQGAAFHVQADSALLARRAILAYGMHDILPDFPGLA